VPGSCIDSRARHIRPKREWFSMHQHTITDVCSSIQPGRR
jgi:hypothetical protein